MIFLPSPTIFLPSDPNGGEVLWSDRLHYILYVWHLPWCFFLERTRWHMECRWWLSAQIWTFNHVFSVVLTTGRTDCWSKQGKFTLLLMRGFERQDFLLSLDRHWLDERSLDLTQWKCVKMKYISIKSSSTANRRRSVMWQTVQIPVFKELPFWTVFNNEYSCKRYDTLRPVGSRVVLVKEALARCSASILSSPYLP